MLKWACTKAKALKSKLLEKTEVDNFSFFMLIHNSYNLLTVQLLTSSEH